MRRALIALLGGVAAYAADVAPSRRLDFNRDIRPILSDTCFACHGPDEKQRQAGLRLDTKEGAFAERPGYRILVPGEPARSRLFQRVGASNPSTRMPPPGFERSLTDRQVQLIRQWIKEGANWETHWSLAAPQRPPLAEVKRKSWPRNGIDHFVLARLEQERLAPSPEADPVTLLRRVTLDLTGLPPTPAEIDAFVADRGAGAYEKQVDRLLRSPRYGERMAMQWLDLARYADTHGYHIDSHRDMWHWRDWLISAFQRNLPFDQFTIEQLAGDLLPEATAAQKIATGFNRNHMINFEGGAIPEEYQTEYVVDRVETTATVWMALTMGCSRCHDHKYDPLRQKDFYRFFAFFNTIGEKGLDGRAGNAEPMLPLPSPEQKLREEELRKEMAEREAGMKEAEIAAAQAEWEKGRGAHLPAASRVGLVTHWELDGHLADTSGGYRHGRAVRGEVTYAEGRLGQSGALSGETHVELGETASFDGAGPFTIALWMRASGIRTQGVLQKLEDGEGRRGYELVQEEAQAIGDLKRGAHLSFRLSHRWPDNALAIQTRKRLTFGEWWHVAITYDGTGKAAGVRLYVDGKPVEVEVLHDSLAGPAKTSAGLSIGDKKLGIPFKGSLDDVRLYNRRLEAAQIENLAIHHPIRTLLEGSGKRSADQRNRLRQYFLTQDAPEPLRKLNAELARLKAEKTLLDKAIATSMVMQEMAKPRDTFVLERGDYRNKTEKVTPGVPAVLPPLAKELPPNRLGLARWLVDPAHPLTARVAVNRYWQMYFGLGLVKTGEDFGAQGEAPSHPELLDWLATDFVRTGWDIRAMQRLIVTSATYRQSSRVSPELLDRDPENRLLARASRFRLPAEMVRDNALAVGGLLVEQIGGPSVFPYQPKGVWEEIAYGDIYSAQTYTAGGSQDLHRRSMYTFWKRTSPPPSLATFDAPDREKCVARRARTNTPLQALVLMNDPTYVEAARALAQRMLIEGGSDPERRLRAGFRLAAGRKPAGYEVRLLARLAREQRADYQRDPAAARKLLDVGESRTDGRLDTAELAAWTAVANVILNLDEVITRE